MTDPLATAVLITVLGMGLLFLALVLFWGLLSLLTWQPRPRRAAGPGGEAETGAQAMGDRMAWAAVAAVVVARAEAEAVDHRDRGSAQAATSEGTPTPRPSAWWSLHHQRRLASWTAACPGRQAREGRQTLNKQRRP